MSEKDPRWERFTALGVVVGLAVACFVFRGRIGADLWPPDRSFVGPNLVAAVVQAAIVTVVLALLYPPFRHAVHRFFDGKLSGLHEKVDALHGRHDQHEANHAALLDRLDRVGQSVAELHEKLEK